MEFIVILAMIAAGHNAVQHYNDVSSYNYQRGEKTPFFSFMLKNHFLVSIGSVIAFCLLIAMAFN